MPLRQHTDGATLIQPIHGPKRPPNLERSMLRHLPAIAIMSTLLSASAVAMDATIDVSNQSDEDLTAITLHPKAERDPTQIVLPSPIAAGQSATVTMTTPGNTCVFDLILTFASTRTVTQPDRDLCQTDAIIIE